MDVLVADVTTPVRRARRAGGGDWHAGVVWCIRALVLVPFVLMAPEIISAAAGRPDGVAHLSASNADVLGTSSFILLVLMLAVTPVQTITGWHWHVVLRRDLGIAMFAVAATDLVLAALTTGDTFPGGLFARVGGHTFLWAGTLATMLTVPLAMTANRRAKRWLGRNWKWLHRVTYAVWAVVLLHLLLLFGFRGLFRNALVVSLALLVPRVPAVRRWWISTRRAGKQRLGRSVCALALAAVFAAGFVPFVHELATVGAGAFTQHPVDD